jgi:hypothetical protein
MIYHHAVSSAAARDRIASRHNEADAARLAARAAEAAHRRGWRRLPARWSWRRWVGTARATGSSL